MTTAALLMRSDPAGDLAQLAFYVIVASVISVVLNSHLSSLRDRAHARDHVVETGRDVLIPDHCVQCGRAHAQETLRITPKFLGVGPVRQVSDAGIHRDYPFCFCGDCARPIRRHRAGSALLQAYALAKKLVRQPEHADLLPHVAEMTRAVRVISGGPKRAPSPEPAPSPAPVPPHGEMTTTMDWHRISHSRKKQ